MTNEELRKEASKIDCRGFKQLLTENPDLPLLVFANEDAYCDIGYPTTQCKTVIPSIEELTLYRDEWMDYDTAREAVENDLCEEDDYKELSDEEFYKLVDKTLNDMPFIKAVVVYVGN